MILPYRHRIFGKSFNLSSSHLDIVLQIGGNWYMAALLSLLKAAIDSNYNTPLAGTNNEQTSD